VPLRSPGSTWRVAFDLLSKEKNQDGYAILDLPMLFSEKSEDNHVRGGSSFSNQEED
jgi:hypothetical protein